MKAVAEAPTRLYYLDWIRVLAMISIFLFHCDRIFDFDGWHINNDVTNLASTIHIQFFNQWMIPLFLLGMLVFVVVGLVYMFTSRSGNNRNEFRG